MFIRVFSVVVTLALYLAGPLAAAPPPDLHDARYGEILAVGGKPGHVTATVYNTIGLNDCPAAKWSALDPTALKKQLGARSVVLNGPRHFLMSHIVAKTPPGPVVTLGGLAMRQVATVPLPAGTLLSGARSKPYADRVVARNTEYVFNSGMRVYELVSPGGIAYIMQSYALIVDPNLTDAALPTLAKRLMLPKGWSYRVRTLSSDLHLSTTNGQAHVVQDDLQDTYQRVSNVGK